MAASAWAVAAIDMRVVRSSGWSAWGTTTSDPPAVLDQVDDDPLGREHQHAADRAAVPGGDAALLVQMRESGQLGQAVVLTGLGDHPLAARLMPDDEHRSRLQQLVQALGGDPVGVPAAPRRGQVDGGQQPQGGCLLAGLHRRPAAGAAPEAGEQAGHEQQHDGGHLLPRVDPQRLVGRGEEVVVGEGGRQRGGEPGHPAPDRGGQRHHDHVDDHDVLQPRRLPQRPEHDAHHHAGREPGDGPEGALTVDLGVSACHRPHGRRRPQRRRQETAGRR
jgi:hypothetical protein